MTCCPNCGQTMPTRHETPAELLPMERKVFSALSRAGNSGLEITQLVNAIYRDRYDGGPISAEKCVHVFVSRANKSLSDFGTEITQHQRFYFIRSDLRSILSLDRSERDKMTHMMMRHITRPIDVSQFYIASQFKLFRSEVRARIIQLRNIHRNRSGEYHYSKRRREPAAKNYPLSHKVNEGHAEWTIYPNAET